MPGMKMQKMKSTDTALKKMELYCMLHPGSPAAVRRPKLLVRAGTWIALLGDSIENGVAGFGSSVEGALRAFDQIYLSSLRPPGD
jgi:hypothetical protein